MYWYKLVKVSLAVTIYASFFLAPQQCCADYILDDSNGKYGLRWEGVGAISGGGATSKLLVDYPEKIQNEILNYLFKPNFGLSLQILKVEIGGDSDATEGSEPSHMHTKDDEDYSRGYEFWLMKEAKKRNPEIKLYGLPWAFPGWLGDTSLPNKLPKVAISKPSETAKYILKWIRGAKRVHGLTIDYVGPWNERNEGEEYNRILRKVIGESEFGNVTTVLNRIVHYPGTTDEPDKQGCSQYEWNTSDGSRWVDEEGSIFDGLSSRCLARCTNRQYISGCHTSIYQWHLISSFYDYFNWPRCGVMVANRPWSEEYEVTSPLWALAHTTQFNPIGWRYAAHGQGVSMLDKGGSMVTRISEDLKDFSIVMEKMQSDSSRCARGSNPVSKGFDENIKIVLRGSFLKAITKGNKSLQVWKSNLTSGDELGENPDDEQLFNRASESLKITNFGDDHSISIILRPNELVTITTLTSGSKGDENISSTRKPFPIPFFQTFDDETDGQAARYWYDQDGAFEIQKNPYSISNQNKDTKDKVLRQVVPQWPIIWTNPWAGPTTYFGPMEFFSRMNLQVSIDILLEDHAKVWFGPYGDGVDEAMIIVDSKSGMWEFGPQKGDGVDFALHTWHTLSFIMCEDKQVVSLDGKLISSINLHASKPWYLKFKMSKYVYMAFNNLRLDHIPDKPTLSYHSYAEFLK